jgi:hypothetical protein
MAGEQRPEPIYNTILPDGSSESKARGLILYSSRMNQQLTKDVPFCLDLLVSLKRKAEWGHNVKEFVSCHFVIEGLMVLLSVSLNC